MGYKLTINIWTDNEMAVEMVCRNGLFGIMGEWLDGWNDVHYR